MEPEDLLEIGRRGIHLLFDRDAINAAFAQDPEELRDAVAGRFEEVRFAARQLASLPDAETGRRFIRDLPAAIRHILVLLYFELLDASLRRNPIRH